jgi:hypothetical protein
MILQMKKDILYQQLHLVILVGIKEEITMKFYLGTNKDYFTDNSDTFYFDSWDKLFYENKIPLFREYDYLYIEDLSFLGNNYSIIKKHMEFLNSNKVNIVLLGKVNKKSKIYIKEDAWRAFHYLLSDIADKENSK